jgi:hypothetical protein
MKLVRTQKTTSGYFCLLVSGLFHGSRKIADLVLPNWRELPFLSRKKEHHLEQLNLEVGDLNFCVLMI